MAPKQATQATHEAREAGCFAGEQTTLKPENKALHQTGIGAPTSPETERSNARDALVSAMIEHGASLFMKQEVYPEHDSISPKNARPAAHVATQPAASQEQTTQARTAQERPGQDRVNHPSHYNSHPAGIECITVIEHMAFNVGNAIKYLWRCGLKPGAPLLEDLKKARWYIDREILRLESSLKK